MPLYEPNLFALMELKARHAAANTIEQALRSVAVLNLALEGLGVDLGQRVERGDILTLGEVGAVAHACQLPMDALTTKPSTAKASRPKVSKLEAARMRQPKAAVQVTSRTTTAIRIYYIAEFLSWYFAHHKARMDLGDPRRGRLEAAEVDVVDALRARAPSESGLNNLAKPEALHPNDLELLYEVTAVDSPDNPWASAHVRYRNALLVRLLGDTGIRKGELAGLKVSDIDFRAGSLLVARRPNDPKDPRRRKPNAKTRDRVLPLAQELTALASQYVINHRRLIAGAKKHDYLLVAENTGAPMSL